MSLLVRTALIWLLALAIPFQGAVAAAMRCCGPQHHHDRTAGASGASHDHSVAKHHHHLDNASYDQGLAQARDASGGHAEHAHPGGHDSAGHRNADGAEALPHEHGGAQAGAAPSAADPGQAAAGLPGFDTASVKAQQADHGDHASKAGKCSVCASCCTATGLPSRAPSVEAPVFAEVQAAVVAAPPLEFTTSGQERPPRSFLV